MSQLVSAVMIVKNGARTIASGLKSLEVFDEVVVFDNGSTDGTQDLVTTFSNVRLYEGEFEGFGMTKNKAVSLASQNIIDKGLRISELKGGSVRHYSYHSISDLITKVERYSSLYAAGNGGMHSNRESMQAGPSKAFFSGIYAFFKTYILKRGFLDGYVGLLIAFSHMATNFYKYMKLYECNRDKAARRGHS